MTYYESEVKKISHLVYSNQYQLNTVIETRNYINNNYDADLNLELLSTVCFVSKYHLLRTFKRYYGTTIKQYTTEKRIEKSKENLKKGMNVTEVCFSVGFECPSSFSTLFKNRTGITPSEFQKEQLSQSRSGFDFGNLKY